MLAAALVATRLDAKPFASVKLNESQKVVLPPRLKKGDVIALTAPAGAIFHEDSIQKATLAFEKEGFRVEHGKTLSQKYGYLAGKDEFRANELHELFENKNVKALVAMRGGWGCARLLPLLDFTRIAPNPKIVCGFSDITTLLLAIYAKTGMVTFHGPVGNSTLEGFTMENFLRIVKDAEAPAMKQPANDTLSVILAGKSTGTLLGGNLTVLCSLLGTGFLPPLDDAMLFLEETEEEPYQVDRLLTQLELQGTLKNANGIIFGKCSKCEAEEPEKSFTLDEVFRQKFGVLSVPVATGFSIGHVKDKFTFPVGASATFDTNSSTLQLNHPCVT